MTFRKRLKRIVAVFGVTVILLFLATGCKKVENPDDYVVVNATQSLKYRLNDDKKTYSVIGIENDFYENTVIIAPYHEGKRVTRIAESAFEGLTSFENVTIPETVTDIGDRAFYGCTKLKTVKLWTFPTNKKYAKVLTELTKGEIFLESASIESAKQICTLFPNSYIYENGQLFQVTDAVYTNYTAKKFDGLSLTYIGEQAFRGCSELVAVNLPDTLTKLGIGAFQNCEKLHSVALPERLLEVKAATFAGCERLYFVETKGDLSIEIGSTDHGEIAKNAKVIKNANGNCTYSSEKNYTLTEDGFLFSDDGDQTVLHAFLTTVLDHPTPDKEQMNQLQSALFISNISNANTNQITTMACNKLTAELPESHQGHTYILKHFIGATDVIIPTTLTEINDDAFAESDLISTVRIQSGGDLKRIGKNAFRNSSIANIIEGTQGLSVYTISSEASEKNNNISIYATPIKNPDISIPNTVEIIDEGAFSGCNNFKTVQLGSGISFIGKQAFADCLNLNTIEICYTDGWTKNGISTNISSYNTMWEFLSADPNAEWCNTLSKLNYNVAETSNSNQDANKRYATLIDLGYCTDSVVRIASSYLGAEVKTINRCASQTLTELHLPKTVTTIDRWAFSDCPLLQTIIYDGTIEQWRSIDFDDHFFDHNYVKIRCIDGEIGG